MHSVTDGPVAQSSAPQDAGYGAQALYVRALMALRDSDGDGAVGLLREALRLQPQHRGIRRNLVRALLATRRFEQVAVETAAALAVAPDDAEMLFTQGTALSALGQPLQACIALARAISLQPDHAAAWLNIANASVELEDLVSAEPMYRTAIRLDPALAEAHASLGYLLTRLGRLPEAITACDTAVRLRPDFAEAQWNLGFAALLNGDWTRGFAGFEWRKQHPQFTADFPPLPGPMWDGSDPVGRTILVRAEQGAGDSIQFMRYLPLIPGAILACSAALVPLARSVPGVQAVAVPGPLPPYDAWIDLGSLPHLFGTNRAMVPASAGYLQADARRIAAWHGRLPQGRKVGLVFAGNPQHANDRRRSIPAERFRFLQEVSGVTFVNLQHGPRAAEWDLPDLTPWMKDFAETAALIACLDLVVTVDTSVAHLAGALGKPTWVLLPHAPDWRWGLGRTDSPWYASVRLFRQPSPNDWDSVLSEVRQALGAFSAVSH